jgi:hypothetical protein
MSAPATAGRIFRITASWRGNTLQPALLGELPRRSVLALAFEAATTLAFSTLFEPFETTWERQIGARTQWHANHAAHACVPSDLPAWIGWDFRVDVIPRKELAGRPQD